MLYLTELMNLPIVAPDGRVYGKLREVVIEPGRDPNLVQSVVYRSSGRAWQVPVRFSDISSEGLYLSSEPDPQPFSLDPAHLLLRRDVLDQQIIDVNGRKVVRVNDVDFETVRRNQHIELRAVRVDVGLAGALRRLLQGAIPRPWLEGLSTWVKPRVIPWHMFDLVEIDPARRVKLQITYKALSRLHPADAADIMEELAPAERQSVFESLDSQVAADILGEVSPRLQRTLLEGVDKEKAADILEEMDPDQAADLLSGLPADRSEQILQDMEAEERDEVTELLEYPEHTAGGHMTTDYVALRDTATVADAGAALQAFEGPVESINTLFLVNSHERLTGVVPVARILLAQSATPLQQLALEAVTVEQDANEDEIAELFDKYNLLALPVVDETRRLLGVITVDDVIALLRKASS